MYGAICGIVLIGLVLSGSIHFGSCQSPCPEYFRYLTDDVTGEVTGRIEIPNAPKDVALHIRISLSVPTTLLTKYVGTLELASSKGESVEAVRAGRPLIYRLHFPLRNPIPLLTEITFNGQRYCTGPRAAGQVVTTIFLEHTLFPPEVMHLSDNPPPTNSGEPYSVDQTLPQFDFSSPSISGDSFDTHNTFHDIDFSSSSISGELFGIRKKFPDIDFSPSSMSGDMPNNYRTLPEIDFSPSMSSDKFDIHKIFSETDFSSPPASKPDPNSVRPVLPAVEKRPTVVEPVRRPQPEVRPSVQYEQPVRRPQPEVRPSVQYEQPVRRPQPEVRPSVQYEQPIRKPQPEARPSVQFEQPITRPRPEVGPSVLKHPSDSTFVKPVLDKNNANCGRANPGGVNYLIANGQRTSPGQWPWLAAIFVTKIEYDFRCGGSLVTDKHIITAAHCKYENGVDLPASAFLVCLGRYQLRNWRERGSKNHEVLEFIPHQDYHDRGSADADLAVITLRDTVVFTPRIRPLCLWYGSDDLQSVVGRFGYVVGWGKDEHGKLVSEPRMAQMPIVSQEDCIKSHRSFKKATSNRTLCAGLRDGSGPCNGDSGGGLVIRDIITDKYYLRGVVSLSLESSSMGCDLSAYTIYADTAKYMDWIRTHTNS